MQTGWTIPLGKIDGVVERKTVTEKLKTVKSRPVREDDVFLCTYPKSGTHWTWEIINMIVAGKAEYAKHWKNSAALEYRSEEGLEELASPRIIQTHLLPGHMPELLWTRRCKVVYVQRNPKDCAVSYFCQMSQQVFEGSPSEQMTYTGSWDEFFRFFIAGSVPYGSIFHHVEKWGNVPAMHKGFEICHVQYEDMKQDCVAQVRKIAEYLDRPLPESTYQEIADACSFENLKIACEKTKDQTFHKPWRDGASGYFRKGQTGDWKNWFTVAQSEEFDRLYELEMKKYPNLWMPFPEN
ncbi:sulfotransferase 1C2-like [Haliotis asinina]|uniref:sulfotransferase 1C2-like n=1 Tax=Haliotis asinina TaxID=109174 RepID=UPI0035324EBC